MTKEDQNVMEEAKNMNLTYVQQNFYSLTNLYTFFKTKEDLFEKIIIMLKNQKHFPEKEYIFDTRNFKSMLNLDENLYPIYNTGVGNCLYNTFSIILFGEEYFYYIIKLASIYILYKNKEFFKELMSNYKYTYTLENLIQKTCRKCQFGNELNVLSISILLDLHIISFNPSNNKNVNNQIIYSLKENSRVALIGLCDLHFFPIFVKTVLEDQKKVASKIKEIKKTIFLLGQERLIQKYKLM